MPEMQVEAGSACVLDHNLPITAPGAARQELPSARLELPAIRFDLHLYRGVRALGGSKLSAAPLRDQLHDPRERAFDRHTLPCGVEESAHQGLVAAARGTPLEAKWIANS